MSLSWILALRMVAVSLTVSILLTLLFLLHYLSDTPPLREATLRSTAMTIAETLAAGRDPAQLRLFRVYPKAYGFRVFDRRLLIHRHILASANTRWLPPVEKLSPDVRNPYDSRNPKAVGSDLFEDFEQMHPQGAGLAGDPVSLLIHRIVLHGRKYWVQTYMIGDPAWAGLPIIVGKLVSHIFFPLLILVPALTLAMFLTTRGALEPVRRLAREANAIGGAVARGEALTPVSEGGMAREFADVAGAVNAMLAKLERSLQLQKQFTADAAHELRTPLAVLLLEVSRLAPSPERSRIKSDLEGLGHVVNELLRFAQAEEAMTQAREQVDLVFCARQVCEAAAPAAVARRQSIEFDHVGDGTEISGSPALIEIAIRNLIDNALTHSPAGATVSVRVEPGPAVIVEDDGPGIPPAERERIFDRFWRTKARSGEGAGVGLALVRRIAQLHGGDIRLEDRPSGGTRMVLTFAPQRGRA